MSVFDDYSKAEIENMTLDVYEGLSYLDQLRIRQEYPETSDRLLAESREAMEDARKRHNADIVGYSRMPLNQCQPRKKSLQNAVQGTQKPFRSLSLDGMTTHQILHLTAQEFDSLSYVDQAKVYKEHKQVYDRIMEEERAEREAERKKWFEKYG